ncbi:hypothetical protein H5410_032776 [Solanum commersonii]|uniref:Secreted protein n=1 Tax=Solanum commersonii TaxID=4109 RepID=A0A9J5YR85_SOLCO|nr:hypothetical protein H5410_032776 [Solanum commersonii]
MLLQMTHMLLHMISLLQHVTQMLLQMPICVNISPILINLNKTHFVTLEILLHEGCMNVYDCLLMGMEHAKFLTFIQLVFELLPKLLKQSGIMKHLPAKFLNEP